MSVAAGLIVALHGHNISFSLMANREARSIVAVLAEPRVAYAPNQAAYDFAHLTNCRTAWLAGLVATGATNQIHQQKAWRVALDCNRISVTMLSQLAPYARSMSEFAVRAQPASSVAWFWLADSYTELSGGSMTVMQGAERSSVIALYERGLSLNSQNSLKWRELGDVMLPENALGAINAYLYSCLTGDEGKNGCWRAGQLAEHLGQTRDAIRYYRLSDWAVALDRAAQLELDQQLQDVNSP